MAAVESSANGQADDMDSESARRKSSTLLPKLPNLGDIVPFQPGGGQRPQPSSSAVIPAPLFVPGVTEILFDGKPIGEYNICGKLYTMEKPVNECSNSMTRDTVGGRKLKYTLTVIQEPARARACGAGPRSSADRRPVDPPPVVQLSVEDENTNEDITMWYDAGFMLYASLEVARPMAHGRMHTGPTMPVLTGVAVASTAYLERPQRAGYFIFPDLSVRHEGWYRLKFSLFEAVKHHEDADVDRPFDHAADDSKDGVISHQSMANRMEVVSSPFQVFSAKKFPGLSESTAISKIVADQGCRVRIRREIRQRKRNVEEKPEDDRRSSRTSPERPFAQPEHMRPASRSSMDNQYYDRMRQSSLDYSRPTPSRNPSIASLTQPSPTVASSSQMTPMGPPPVKYEVSPTYSPIPKATDLQYMTSQATQFPPIPARDLPEPRPNLGLNRSIPFDPTTRQYDLPGKATAKRSYSPNVYDDKSALKAGARPDNLPVRGHRPLAATDVIEADDGEDDDDSYLVGPYSYPRADGYLVTKSDPRERMWSAMGLKTRI